MLTRKLEGDAIVFYSGANRILTVQELMTENGVLMNLTGELRSDTAQSILDELTAFATVGVKVTVDFSKVTFISSAVMDALHKVQKTLDDMGAGELLLRALPPEIYRKFWDTGMSELLRIE